METEKKEVKKWYRRGVLEQLWWSNPVSFGVRGLLVTALMLCGVGWIANATSTPHWWSTMIAAAFITVLGLWFGHWMRHWGPSGSWSLFRRLFAEFQHGRGARRYRRFMVANLVILVNYAAVVFHSWYLALFNDWFYRGDWRGVAELAGKMVLDIVVVAGVLLLLWLVWEGVQRLRETYGRREPYEQAIGRWRRALEAERRAHAQLREAQKVSGVGIATAITLLRAVPKHRGDAQIGQAKHALQGSLAVLVPDDDQRDAMLERARRKVEDEEQPSAASGGPSAA